MVLGSPGILFTKDIILMTPMLLLKNDCLYFSAYTGFYYLSTEEFFQIKIQLLGFGFSLTKKR